MMPGEKLMAHLDGLPKEAFSQDFSVDEVTWAENAMRAATGGSQRLRASDVSCY